MYKLISKYSTYILYFTCTLSIMFIHEWISNWRSGVTCSSNLVPRVLLINNTTMIDEKPTFVRDRHFKWKKNVINKTYNHLFHFNASCQPTTVWTEEIKIFKFHIYWWDVNMRAAHWLRHYYAITKQNNEGRKQKPEKYFFYLILIFIWYTLNCYERKHLPQVSVYLRRQERERFL